SGQECFYLVAAVLDSTAVDNRAFKVGFAAGGVTTSQGALGTAVGASDSNKVSIAVTASLLTFIQLPADTAVVDKGDEVVSGKIFSTQPIVGAQDAFGNTDLDFSETLTARISSGSGTLGGTADKLVVNGKANYVGNALFYTATADGEAFTLMVDDAAGGTDLTAATANLSVDVVGTKLVFAKQPTPLADPGANFAQDSVNVAIEDSSGLVDKDYVTQVLIQAVSAEDTTATVAGLTTGPTAAVTPKSGLATWYELRLAMADLIVLKATSGSLITAFSDIAATPGRLTVGSADSLVASNALSGLAGTGGTDLVLNAVALKAVGERMPITYLKVKPVFAGLVADELGNIDLVIDADADGRVDSTEKSVLAAARNDSGSGVELILSVLDTLPADTLRHYLVVGDLDHTVRSTDALRIDMTDLAVGNGLATGVAPVVPVRSVAGRDHAVSGVVSVVSVALERPRVRQQGKVTLVFDAVSDLAAGDELVLDFPLEFGVGDASVDTATATPSGVDPTKSTESAGHTVVLMLGAQESRGRYQIVLDKVQNPAFDQGASRLSIHTRLADNTLVDSADAAAPGLQLVGEGRIDLSATTLANGSVGQSGQVRLVFSTVTALEMGDEIELIFPPAFELSNAVIATATKTLSGIDPQIATGRSSGQVLILKLLVSEAAGEIALVIEEVGFPLTADRDLTVEVQTRQEDGQILDAADQTPALFALSGRLILGTAAAVEPVLFRRAGVGGNGLVLASFALEALGDAIPLQAIELLPHLVGVGAGELAEIDIIGDANGDGAIDADEESVAVGVVDDGGDGVSLSVVLADRQLAPGERRSYLVVADVAASFAATDQIQIEVVGVTAGVGALSGVVPVVLGGPVAGPVHRATGRIELMSVELEQRQRGQSGRVVLSFITVSALAAGDRIRLTFPPGFDLGQAAIDAASTMPSGALPVRDAAASTRQELVIELAGAENLGAYRLALTGVVNPTNAGGDLTIAIGSERADGTTVDAVDPMPFLFAISAAAEPTACRADFDGDGRVYFSDLFLFGDAFGVAGSSVFDLDGDNRVNLADFFVFSEIFGSHCDAAAIDPVDESALAVEIAVDVADNTPMRFALVRSGSFNMGSPTDEEGRGDDEGPQHIVEISQPFYLGQFEVTQGQWQAVMGTKPWRDLPAVIDSSGHPAVYISWNDAQAFVQRLNAAVGDTLYRLPTEAEWEFAARAGAQTRWSFGNDETDLVDFAWTRRVPPVVSELVTHLVGSKRPNAWAFYDIYGSAAEWVQDYYGTYEAGAVTDPLGPVSGAMRVLRGGGIALSALEVRAAARDSFDPGVHLSTFGFRVVRRIVDN
ncbi:MAG: formylglycine-generating enzyme family protein, partial [Candidatus Latescibacterota bacterium]|nr:formylglycine-generating enzyme family protein [Candidatus Latescibacterota bacterium]